MANSIYSEDAAKVGMIEDLHWSVVCIPEFHSLDWQYGIDVRFHTCLVALMAIYRHHRKQTQIARGLNLRSESVSLQIAQHSSSQ